MNKQATESKEDEKFPRIGDLKTIIIENPEHKLILDVDKLSRDSTVVEVSEMGITLDFVFVEGSNKPIKTKGRQTSSKYE